MLLSWASISLAWHWMKSLTSVGCAVDTSSCYHVLNWFFLPKPAFLEFIWIFSSRNQLKINISYILSPNLTKRIPWNPAHQDLFKNTKGTIQFVLNFQLLFYLIFSEKIIQYSRTFALPVKKSLNQITMRPSSSSRAFQRHQEQELKHPHLVDLIPTFLHSEK
jgi:hypothetical protein